MEKLEKDAQKIIDKIKQKNGNSPDLLIKEIPLNLLQKVYLLHYKSLTDNTKINEFILKGLQQTIRNNKTSVFKNTLSLIEKSIPNSNTNIVDNYSDLFLNLFSGYCVIVLNDYQKAIAFEATAHLDRGIVESTTEQIIQGPKEGLNESYEKNVGLIRKRIKSENLWLEETIVGRETKTKVGMLYIKGIAEEELINSVRQKINSIDIDGIMDISYVDNLIDKEQKYSFPPHLKTERPDWISMGLLEGKVVLLTENSPFALVIPTFLIDYFHTPDCYYQKAIHNTIMRLVRLLAFIVSLLAPAIYISLISYNQEIIPHTLLLNIVGQRQTIPFPAFIEALLLLFSFELMREGDIKTPQNIGSSIAILGAVILGQAGIMAGLVSPIMVIIISLTSISALVFQSLDVIYAIRIWRYIFIIFATVLGIVGIMACGLLFCTLLCSVKSFGKPYMYPFAPLDFEGLKDSFFRIPIASSKRRPAILAGQRIIKHRKV